MRTEIVYEDKDILVVYKPAGLATQTARLGQADVVSELKNYLAQTTKNIGAKSGAQNVYLGVIHRLDQPVEGLLVFAKQKKAAAELTAQLQRQGEDGSLHKNYYAVVCGQLEQKQGRLVDYMYKSAENLAVIVEPGKGPGGSQNVAKEAVLEYRIVNERKIPVEAANSVGAGELENATNKKLALTDIHILTGRFHQIRAQMSHAGMPLLGDVKYGSSEVKELSGTLGVRTVALCAYSLDFQHPVTKKKMHFEENPCGNVFKMFL